MQKTFILATVALTLGMSFTPLLTAAELYESFDYPVGRLNGAGGTTEVGFTGT